MSEQFPIEVYRQMPAAEAADFLGLSIRKLEKMRREGDGPRFVKVGHNCIRYRLKDLIDFQELHLRANNREVNGGSAR